MDKVPKREWYAFSKFFNEILKSDTNYVLIIIIFFYTKMCTLIHEENQVLNQSSGVFNTTIQININLNFLAITFCMIFSWNVL